MGKWVVEQDEPGRITWGGSVGDDGRVLVYVEPDGGRWEVIDGYDFGSAMANGDGDPWGNLLDAVERTPSTVWLLVEEDSGGSGHAAWTHGVYSTRQGAEAALAAMPEWLHGAYVDRNLCKLIEATLDELGGLDP